MDGRPTSRTGLQVIDFVRKTKIKFSACAARKDHRWDFFNDLLTALSFFNAAALCRFK